MGKAALDSRLLTPNHGGSGRGGRGLRRAWVWWRKSASCWPPLSVPKMAESEGLEPKQRRRAVV